MSVRVPRSFLLSFVTLAMAAATAPRAAFACDSSGCLLVTRSQNGLLGKGVLRVDVSYRRTPMTDLLQGSETVAEVRRPKIDFENRRLVPGYHDELGGNDEFLHLDLAYGVGSRTSLFASIPVLTSRAFDIGHFSLPSETYSTTGNGDLLLGVRHSILRGGSDSLVGGLMVEVPLGEYTLRAPADRLDSGILDPMLQPGSGSVGLGGTLQYGRKLAGTWDATAAASYQAYTTNDLDYREGADAIASLTVSRPVWGPVGGSLQLKGLIKDRNHFMGDPLSNSGGRFLYLVPGVSVRAPVNMGVFAYFVVPVYRYVNEAQLAPKTGLVVGLSRSF